MNQIQKTKHFIYCLEFYDEYNEKTGKYDATKRYIGRTKDLKRRWSEHKNGLGGIKRLRHRNFEKCRFILEDVGNEDNIQNLEQKWIDHYGIENLLNANNAKNKK